MNQTKAYYIEEFERLFEGCKTGTDYMVYKAYKKSQELGQDLIDFCDIIWPDDVESLINTLKTNGIKKFTISCYFGDMLYRLADFEKLGCRINGLTNIKTGRQLTDGSQETAPAFKMEIL